MYEQPKISCARQQRIRFSTTLAPLTMASLTMALLAMLALSNVAPAQELATPNAGFTGFGSPNIIRKISRQSERLEMTSNSSRILTLDVNIPRVQVNNPELVAVTPLSAKQIQISAKKPGVTQINLWDSNQKIHTIDIIIYGDVRELEFALKTQFPNSSVGVRKFSQSLMLTGFIDSPAHVEPIMRLAEDYAPKVINNLRVGGVQQVLLKVKIFEVSRTKLRRLGVDWASFGSGGNFAVNSVSGLIGSFDSAAQSVTATGQTFSFGIVNNASSFFGFLDALEENKMAKVLAEPNIVAISGRPAQFLEGGETPILIPQGQGNLSIEYKPFGTQIDFLPIVLGNGNIRLEVRPEISELDTSIGIVTQNLSIPGFRVRKADTAVEMKAGQTFALAGLIQRRTESITRGLPFVKDIPIIGVPFRKVEERVNEIELLILVTPELVDAMDPHEVPECGPGMGSMSPSNCQLYFGGQIEVPNAYGPCGPGCQNGQGPCNGCETATGAYPSYPNEIPTPATGYSTEGVLQEGLIEVTPSSTRLNNGATTQNITAPAEFPAQGGPGARLNHGNRPRFHEQTPGQTIHGELRMPVLIPGTESPSPNKGARFEQARSGSPTLQANRSAAIGNGYAMQRPGQYRRGTPQSAPPRVLSNGPNAGNSDLSDSGGLIGPVGYDVQ